MFVFKVSVSSDVEATYVTEQTFCGMNKNLGDWLLTSITKQLDW